MKKLITAVKKPKYFYSFPQPQNEIAFFDIETTGLSAKASSLYLIGLMYFEKSQNQWVLCQWFADDYHSEKEILTDFLQKLASFSYLYHFNGKTFDIPYVLKKCKRHAVSIPVSCHKMLYDKAGKYSIDLLQKIRPFRHALLLDSCRQNAVERCLGLHRADTFSGQELISVYSEYMQQKILCPENAAALEKVLLLHNHDDVEMMLAICSLLTYDEYLSDDFSNRLLDAENLQDLSAVLLPGHHIQVHLPLPYPVPKELSLSAAYPSFSDAGSLDSPFSDEPPSLNKNTSCLREPAELKLKNNDLSLTIPVFSGTLKYFFKNYQEYYYLPQEDMAIHQSVAKFTEYTHRKKATAATCYIKQEGIFLPSLSLRNHMRNLPPQNEGQEDASTLEPFFFQYKDKLTFYQLPKDFTQNQNFWKSYLSLQLPLFR